MSRYAEAALLYERAKEAMLIGFGYLAARRPKLALKVGYELGSYFLKTMVRDTGAVTKIIWRDLAKPVLAEDAAILSYTFRTEWANIVARGPIFGTTLILTTGGAVAHTASTGYEALAEYLGWDTPTNIEARID